MRAIDVVGHLGHRVHIARGREARTLFSWLGHLGDRSLLDVGGGDGYWAAQARRKGAVAYSIDIEARRTDRGHRYSNRPLLIRGDALQLPFADASFDAVMSISSLEHFESTSAAITEMARVLKVDGHLVLSADSLAGSDRWPRLAAAHMDRYAVKHALDHEELEGHLIGAGLKPIRHAYLFKSGWTNRLYLELSRHRLAWNAAAPLSPLVALADRRADQSRGSIVLIHARRHSAQEPSVSL